MYVRRSQAFGIKPAKLLLRIGESPSPSALTRPKASIIAQAHHRLQMAQFPRVQSREDALVGEEDDAFRVVGQALDGIQREIIKNRYRHRMEGAVGQQGHGPMGGVLAADGHFVPGLQAQVLVCKMEFLQFCGDLRVTVVTAFVVAECRSVPLGQRHFFEVGEKVFHTVYVF